MPPTWFSPTVRTWQRDAASKLVEASSPAEILAIEKRYGFASFDAEKTAAFDELVRRFARPEFAKSGSPLVRAVAAPPLFWNFQSGRLSPGRSPIERVDVYRLTRWYHRGKIKTIRNVLVHTIQINPPNLEGPSSI